MILWIATPTLFLWVNPNYLPLPNSPQLALPGLLLQHQLYHGCPSPHLLHGSYSDFLLVLRPNLYPVCVSHALLVLPGMLLLLFIQLSLLLLLVWAKKSRFQRDVPEHLK